MPELKRTLGVLGAASLCIGAIIGAGFFLIGVIAYYFNKERSH